VSGKLTLNGSASDVKGYEIHVGKTQVKEKDIPIQLDSGAIDGAVNSENTIFGTYLHGLFDNSEALASVCEWAGASAVATVDHHALKEEGIDRIADAIEEYMKLDLLWPELDTIKK
ncbi:cobyric acid synthase CobQ, partial [Vibrio fortis]